MKNTRLTKGDLYTADLILGQESARARCSDENIEQAKSLGLVEFDGADRRWYPTQTYVDLLDKLYPYADPCDSCKVPVCDDCESRLGI